MTKGNPVLPTPSVVVSANVYSTFCVTLSFIGLLMPFFMLSKGDLYKFCQGLLKGPTKEKKGQTKRDWGTKCEKHFEMDEM